MDSGILSSIEVKSRMEIGTMKTQLNRAGMLNFEGASGPELITIPLPEEFHRMTAAERIQFLSDALKAIEAKYPLEKEALRRHTSLVRIADGKVTYSVEYLPMPDDDY
ncbi:MAG: hypothetical protein ACUVS3_05710 [Thermodesulfobacteriota bacterium]